MIKPRLYIKIFLTYIILLIITEILIFAVFRYVSITSIHRDFHAYLKESSQVLRRMVMESLASGPGSYNEPRHPIHFFIDSLGKISRSQVWLSADDGRTVSKSFEGDIPVIHEEEMIDAGEYKYYHSFRKSPVVYFKLAVQLPDRKTGNIHFVHKRNKPPFNEGRFLIALGIIGIGIAFLLYPLSLYITRPLKKLTMSAIKISEGDLKERVSIRAGDEIGELAAAFNAMTEKIEQMIKGARELSANISHELRSPLTRIRLALEMLQDCLAGVNRKDAPGLIESAESEIEEMDRLIGRILKLSRLDFSGVSFERKKIDMTLLIESILERYSPLIVKKGIRIAKSVEAKGISVSGHEEDIRAALSNLIDNAVKYTTEGGAISVRLFNEGGIFKAEIFNACSLPVNADMDAIFEPFKRLDGADNSGTGLGLAISKKIIVNHGGSIRADMRDDGILFTLSLPAAGIT